jgi:hypothetical protein
LTPNSLEQIFANVRELGEATGRAKEADELIANGRARLEKIAAVTSRLSHRPRVFCMEWLDPVYCSGHWVPEMVRLAGGEDTLAREGADSVRIPWDAVREWAPEVLIITPCGFNLEKTIEQAFQLFTYDGWANLPAVREGRVYAVSLYFGLRGTPAGARMFNLVFGVVYGLIGVVGFLLGSNQSPSAGVPGPADSRLWKVIPSMLELGTSDHILHIVLGLVFVIGGLLNKAETR